MRALMVALVLVGCGGGAQQTACVEGSSQAAAAPGDTAPAAASGDENAQVVLDGTPEIPLALHARLQQYLETRTARLQDIADDGASVLITTRFANTSQAHSIASPLGDRHQLTFGDEPVFGASYIPGVDDAVLIQSDVGGHENYQLYRFDLTSGQCARHRRAARLDRAAARARCVTRGRVRR